MPNIIITEYCNLKCPYCFASKMMTDTNHINQDKEITLTQLQKILNWLYPSAIKKNFSIGIIGGEPTLHSNFPTIINSINSFCSITNSNATLFTNGILLYKYLHLIHENMGILININKLEKEKEQQLNQSLNLINQLNWFKTKKVTIGCNLYQDEKDYDYFWEKIIKYKDITNIRISVTAPTDFAVTNKELYYLSMKDIFLKFIKNAEKYNLKIYYDCNQIPLCLFSTEEQNLILSLGDYNNFCEPVIDITPAFKATSCFGCYHLVNCSDFENIENLQRYFQKEMYLKTSQNKISFCENCSKIDFMNCQGGCLSFVNKDNF